MDCFGIFAKYWEPGRVKTRLAAAVGNEAASVVYRQFIHTLVKRFDQTGDQRVLCFTPSDRSGAFDSLGGDQWLNEPQASGDLGERMTAYFASCFDRGAQRVVLIGSDSPTMPIEYVESAFQFLRETDVVLGPTDDGGYYLVGASCDASEMFRGIDWSTPQVWDQTIARLSDLGLTYGSLPKWYDVDDASDLERLRDELQANWTDTSATSDLLTTIQDVL